MRKSDVEISYHNGTAGMPMVNVKMHRWTLTADEWSTLESEFAGFRAWWDALEESSAHRAPAQARRHTKAIRSACWKAR
jgi:hypothetical protein